MVEMERWVGKVAVVTGASFGIGAQIAKVLVKHGLKVVGCSRSFEVLQEIAKGLEGESGEFIAVKCDVTKEADVVSMFDTVRKLGTLAVCVNNAGLCHPAPILSGNVEQWREMFEVNVIGVALCTREAAKIFHENDATDGHIININGGYGHFVPNLPDLNVYSASKHAVTALTQGTRSELKQKNSKVKVTDISMYMTETDILRGMMGMTTDEMRKFYEQNPHLNTDDIAQSVVYVMSAPSHVQVRELQLSHQDNP